MIPNQTSDEHRWYCHECNKWLTKDEVSVIQSSRTYPKYYCKLCDVLVVEYEDIEPEIEAQKEQEAKSLAEELSYDLYREQQGGDL